MVRCCATVVRPCSGPRAAPRPARAVAWGAAGAPARLVGDGEGVAKPENDGDGLALGEDEHADDDGDAAGVGGWNELEGLAVGEGFAPVAETNARPSVIMPSSASAVRSRFM